MGTGARCANSIHFLHVRCIGTALTNEPGGHGLILKRRSGICAAGCLQNPITSLYDLQYFGRILGKTNSPRNVQIGVVELLAGILAYPGWSFHT